MMIEKELKKKIEKLEQKIGEIHYHFEAVTQELWLECRETRNIFHSYLFANILYVGLYENRDSLEKKQGEELIRFYEELGSYYKKIVVIDFHVAYALMNQNYTALSSMGEKGYIKLQEPNKIYGFNGTEFIKKEDKNHLLTYYEEYVKEYNDFFEKKSIPLLKILNKNRLYFSFYYFNVNQKCVLREENKQIVIVVLNKENEEIECLHVNKPNEIAATIQTYLEEVRRKNRVKHVLQEERYFLNDFLQMLNIDDLTIKNKFYSLLQSSYNSIEIEELAFLYLKKREKIKKRPISGGFFLFQFGNQWYVINQEKLNIHEIKEEELESFLLTEYQEKVKKELTVFLSKKENN